MDVEVEAGAAVALMPNDAVDDCCCCCCCGNFLKDVRRLLLLVVFEDEEDFAVELLLLTEELPPPPPPELLLNGFIYEGIMLKIFSCSRVTTSVLGWGRVEDDSELDKVVVVDWCC